MVKCPYSIHLMVLCLPIGLPYSKMQAHLLYCLEVSHLTRFNDLQQTSIVKQEVVIFALDYYLFNVMISSFRSD